MAKVFSISSAKGGVAKSSSTVEIATVLAQYKKRVLVIDLDENCSLSKNVGAEIGNNKSIYEILHGSLGSIEEAIQHLDLFDIIAGSKQLSLVAKEFVERDDVYLLADLMDMLKEEYDYIFLDNAPSQSLLLTMTYISADYVIIPTVCDESSSDMVYEVEHDVAALRNNRNHDSHAEIIGYILTRYKGTNMDIVALEKLQDEASTKEVPPFVMTVSDAVIVSEVKTYRTAVCAMRKSSKTAREYYAITDEIIRRVE